MICRKCGKSMTINFAWEQNDEERPHYSHEDEWICSCGFSMPCRRYSDWFGGDDLHKEVANYLEGLDEQPLRILYSGFMVCVIFPQEVAVLVMMARNTVIHFTSQTKNPKFNHF